MVFKKLRVYVIYENFAEISNVGAPIDPEITDGFTRVTLAIRGEHFHL